MIRNFSKTVSLITLVSIASMNISLAAPNYNYQGGSPAPQYQNNYYAPQQQQYRQGSTLKGRVVNVPAGVIMNTVVTTPISSEFMTVGQFVCLTLGSDFYYGGNLIAPAGSSVNGMVVEAKKAKHGTINGQLRLKFTEIVTPFGTRVPISASVKTSDGTGLLKGGTKMDSAKEYAKDIAVGSAAGALTGLVASAISGGAVGKGTAIMTGVGAGAGLLKSGWDKGEDVVIPSNASLELQMDQPITVNPTANSYDY